jgi:hypothetical protein
MRGKRHPETIAKLSARDSQNQGQSGSNPASRRTAALPIQPMASRL